MISSSLGHYFEEDLESAKEDFATRAGLVPPDRLLSSEQFVEVYRAVHETLESDHPIYFDKLCCFDFSP